MNLFELLETDLSQKLPPKNNIIPQVEHTQLKESSITEPKNGESSPYQQLYPFGLTDFQAKHLLEKNGENILNRQKKISKIKIFANQYKDIMTIILLVCTGISVLMGEYVEAVAIALIILLNGILGYFQEYKTEKTLSALKNMAAPSATVYRDNKMKKIPTKNIVVGDVVHIKEGDKICADGKIISQTSFSCDESMLTGESDCIKKTEYEPVFGGCIAKTGHAIFKVTSTGMDTKMGKIASLLQEIKEEPTPLQIRLAKLSKFIAIGCILICCVVTLTGILRGEPLFQMLITGVSLAVAAVPEGLPAIVTIALALSVSRMVKQNALVRRIHAVETLGCTTVLCTDKTGTLTQNKMTVTDFFTLSKTENESLLSNQAIVLCNNAVINEKKEEDFGEPTEISLLNFAKINGFTLNELSQKFKRISENPFNSDKKFMSVCVKNSKEERFLFVKGAYDILIDKCSNCFEKENLVELTHSKRILIENENNNFATNALRVICVAFKKLNFNDEMGETKLTFLCLIGMQDPPRPEVRPAVLSCYKAGIKTVMITGDHKKTAIAIAKKVGIFHKGDKCLEGRQLDLMNINDLCEVINSATVFARVNPSHKLMIVKAFKKCGHVVAMTGDGVNDAPAIRQADIGVAMGKNGTDVTREASQIILLDDNFATLVSAVKQGRGIYDNIRKFIRYLLSCNIGEVITMFLSMIFGMPLILFPIQILLVNLVTDGLPAIALSLEPTDDKCMSRLPRKSSESVFSNGLALKIVFRGILIGLTTLTSFSLLFSMTGNENIARTAALFSLVFTQLIHVFECKSEEKTLFSISYFNNIKLILASLFSLFILMVVIYVPFFQAIFCTVALTFSQVIILIGLCFVAPLFSCIFHIKK